MSESERRKKMETENALTLETRKAPWWLLLMGGILAIMIGILLLVMPVRSAVTLAWALGLYWLMQGTFTLVLMFIDHSAWGWKLFIGILGIIAGLVVMSYPVLAAAELPMIFTMLLGLYGIFGGIMALFMAFKGGGWGSAILGVISIIFGLILLANWSEIIAVVSFYWVVAIFAVIGGIVQIVHAFQQRSAAKKEARLGTSPA
jgi:uncharacterized membrane protein HdeD (DUF308 family)